jgi:hypothetical protein
MPTSLAFTLLFNKRSETAGFVLLCPVYIVMLKSWLDAKTDGKMREAWFHLFFLGAAWVLTSFLYTDFFSRGVKDVADEIKIRTLGVIVVYVWALVGSALIVFKKDNPVDFRRNE